MQKLKLPEKIEEMQSMVRLAGGAEQVNDDYKTCPSRRLKSLCSSYNKKLHGPVICQQIGLKTICAQCPRFAQWLGKIIDQTKK